MEKYHRHQSLVFVLFASLLFLGACKDSSQPRTTVVNQPTEITVLEQLSQLQGVTVQQRTSPVAGYDYYFLLIEQPVDHNQPNGTTFSQQARLLLKDTSQPTILRTNGYGLFPEQNIGLMELTEHLSANQLEVEHRYFNDSTPEHRDWQYLTIWQAASDHNRIIELLSPVLKNRWLATGKSKGGMSATYLKRFYPNAIAGVVAYVAPLSLSLWDERFAQYSLTVVEPQCAEKYQQYQRQALLRMQDLMVIINQWATSNELNTSSNDYSLSDRLQAEITLSWIEMGSYYQDMLCQWIPTPEDDDLTYVEFMYQSSQFTFLTDQGLERWLPYHIQAAAELGNFSAPLSHLEDLLTFDVTDFQLNLLDQPMPTFRPEVMQDIYDWAKFEASELIMIYGQQDIFTGGAYPITTDSVRDTQLHIEPGLHSIRIQDLPEDARNAVLETTRRWVNAP